MIKVLVIDDSAVVRRVLSEELSKASDIEVVATAIDPYVAREKILALEPDVVTLDLELPRMGGLTFLDKLMTYHPLPVIVVSSQTSAGSEAALRALELGAVDVLAKPQTAQAFAQMAATLVERIRSAASARPTKRRTPQPPPTKLPGGPATVGTCGLIVIGASTGGTQALMSVLSRLPADLPGILIVQHMPAAFTAAFAEHLNQASAMQVRQAVHGEPVLPGLALVAPGDQHMTLRKVQGQYRVEIKTGPPVHHQRPSVDVLFHSVAAHAGNDALGILLTGMGRDGAAGLLAMRQARARTIAQDQDSCVVFGMPREAIELGAAQSVVPLVQIPSAILSAVGSAGGRRRSVAKEARS